MVTDELAPTTEREARLLGKAVARARDAMDITQGDLATMLGISEASASRLVAGDYVLARGSKPWELAVLMLRAFRSLDALVGGRRADIRAWLHTNNRGVNGVPAQLMKRTEGMVRVLHYLDASRGLI